MGLFLSSGQGSAGRVLASQHGMILHREPTPCVGIVGKNPNLPMTSLRDTEELKVKRSRHKTGGCFIDFIVKLRKVTVIPRHALGSILGFRIC
jgi:hypothetical protein